MGQLDKIELGELFMAGFWVSGMPNLLIEAIEATLENLKVYFFSNALATSEDSKERVPANPKKPADSDSDEDVSSTDYSDLDDLFFSGSDTELSETEPDTESSKSSDTDSHSGKTNNGQPGAENPVAQDESSFGGESLVEVKPTVIPTNLPKPTKKFKYVIEKVSNYKNCKLWCKVEIRSNVYVDKYFVEPTTFQTAGGECPGLSWFYIKREHAPYTSRDDGALIYAIARVYKDHKPKVGDRVYPFCKPPMPPEHFKNWTERLGPSWAVAVLQVMGYQYNNGKNEEYAYSTVGKNRGAIALRSSKTNKLKRERFFDLSGDEKERIAITPTAAERVIRFHLRVMMQAPGEP